MKVLMVSSFQSSQRMLEIHATGVCGWLSTDNTVCIEAKSLTALRSNRKAIVCQMAGLVMLENVIDTASWQCLGLHKNCSCFYYKNMKSNIFIIYKNMMSCSAIMAVPNCWGVSMSLSCFIATVSVHCSLYSVCCCCTGYWNR